MLLKFALPLLLSLLCGCAAKMTLIDRQDGNLYYGSTDSTTMGGAGNATLEIEGRKYVGPWIYQPNGGSFGLSNFSSSTDLSGSATTYTRNGGYGNSNFNGTSTTKGSGSTFATSTVGNGMINARAENGEFMRCIFTFHTMQNTGIGECRRNDGRAYDLTLRR
jgi:hypothetical protein